MTDLERCKKCGGDPVAYTTETDSGVECSQCGIRLRDQETWVRTVAAWNRNDFLEPCPQCKSENVKRNSNNDDIVQYVQCLDCEYTLAKACMNFMEAVYLWNYQSVAGNAQNVESGSDRAD